MGVRDEDTDSGAVVANLGTPGKLGQVAWSPDGSHVAMVSGADLNDPAAGRLLVARATGGALEDVLPNYMGHVSAVAFRDANTLVFIGDEGEETVFGEVKVVLSARTSHPVVPGSTERPWK